MSELPKCKLCGCASHRMSSNADIYHKGQGCPLDGVWFSRDQWRTLMTQQAGDSTDQLRFKSACEISGEKHPEYVRGYEAAMDAVCKQQAEPVEYQRRMRPLWDSQEVWTPWEKCTKGTYDDCIRVPVLHDLEHQVRALYTAPQAQPAPAVDDSVVYICHKCKAKTKPPSAFKFYVRCDFCGELTAASAAEHKPEQQAQPAPIPTGWQPIETAPNDVHVLVHYAKHITDLDARWAWDDDALRTFVAMRSGGCWIQNLGIGESVIVEPTHWQPLPPAPGGEG